MPLKVDHVRAFVAFPFLVFGEGVPKRLESSASGRVIGFSGITRRLPISIKLKHEGFLPCQRDRQVIKFEHTHLFESFKRPRTIRSRTTPIKKNVPLTFTPVSVPAKGVIALQNLITLERPCLACTEITATVSAIESQKKDSTHRGIQNVCTRIKCKLSYTELCTVYRGGS